MGCSRRIHAAVLAGALAVGAAARPAHAQGESWATTQAIELTRQGHARLQEGETDAAARRFLEAITIDATHGPAYVALGTLRERTGDAREAERAYSMAIDRAPSFAQAYLARSRLFDRHSRHREALADLEAAAVLRPDDAAILHELAAAYLARSALPAALAVMRRIATVAADEQDPELHGEASTKARAIAMLVGDADPVSAGARGRGPVRSAMALHLSPSRHRREAARGAPKGRP